MLTRTAGARAGRLKDAVDQRGVGRWVRMPRLHVGGALGAGSAGAISLGAFAAGAGAIGALAIGRLAIRRGAIGSLEIEELTVRRLVVDELTVAGERAGPPASAGRHPAD